MQRKPPFLSGEPPAKLHIFHTAQTTLNDRVRAKHWCGGLIKDPVAPFLPAGMFKRSMSKSMWRTQDSLVEKICRVRLQLMDFNKYLKDSESDLLDEEERTFFRRV